jgi:hypothetical protein
MNAAMVFMSQQGCRSRAAICRGISGRSRRTCAGISGPLDGADCRIVDLFCDDSVGGAQKFCARARAAFNLGAMSSGTSTSEAGLRGRLEQFGLATVLTLLDLERRSGELVIVAGDKLARLWISRGRVLRARLEGSRRASKSVVYELLALSRGRFAFTQMNLEETSDEIGAPTTLLLMEAARRADEASASSPSCL